MDGMCYTGYIYCISILVIVGLLEPIRSDGSRSQGDATWHALYYCMKPKGVCLDTMKKKKQKEWTQV